MAALARAQISAEGESASDVTVRCEIDMRYFGQAFEVPMQVGVADFRSGKGVAALTAAFDAEHRRLFTFNMEAEHELVNLRAIALGKELELPAAEIERGDGDPRRAKTRDHELWIGGGAKPAVIYDRPKLRAGDRIKGPAIVIEMDSTTLIHPGFDAEVDRFGNILITPH
jgi:N-methylhydantoinase A